jgi:hypothetical protein
MLTNEALADSRDLRKADQLFRSAKERLAQEDYARACPMLAESFKLDPATGTLLALAICHERQGKLGSAFHEYNQVVARCKNEARPDREQAARDRALALEARLSTLTVKTSNVSDVEALEVRINGARLDRTRLDKALAVDGGTQVIEASAQGKKPWRADVHVAKSVEAKIVVIPALDDVSAPKANMTREELPVVPAQATLAQAPPPPVREASPTPATSAHPTDQSTGLTATQWVGLGTIGAGVIALGAGTFFTARAISRNSESSKGCIGDVCTALARQARIDARAAGNAATIAFVTGGALAVAGVSMYLLGQRSSPTPSAATTQPAFAATPWAAPHEIGATLHGSF